MHKDKPPKLDLKTLQVIVEAAREDGCKEFAVLARARRTQARNPRLVAERCRPAQ